MEENVRGFEGHGLSCPSEHDPDKAFKPMIRSNTGIN